MRIPPVAPRYIEPCRPISIERCRAPQAARCCGFACALPSWLCLLPSPTLDFAMRFRALCSRVAFLRAVGRAPPRTTLCADSHALGRSSAACHLGTGSIHCSLTAAPRRLFGAYDVGGRSISNSYAQHRTFTTCLASTKFVLLIAEDVPCAKMLNLPLRTTCS